jgi:transposase
MEVLHGRCAGLDVHKDLIVACVRLMEGERIRREFKRFGTTTRELLGLLEWLQGYTVTQVGMESTGVYWKPVWHVLEGHFTLVLGNAQKMRNVPGRKSDQNDASWIADLVAHGLIRSSLVPEAPMQELRELTRTRKQLVRERAQHVQRIQKVLEDANVKLSSVLSDILGLSGRAILEALASGKDDPQQLAALAHPSVKAPRSEIAEALEGRVREHHRFMIRLHLDQIDALEAAVARVEGRIEKALSPFRAEVERLCTIPGFSTTVAAAFLAETGGKMEAFPTDGHLAAWGGLSPQQNETGGKRKNTRTRPQRWFKTMMVQAAHAAVKKKDSHLRAKYYRIRARRGSKKAILAVAATQARIAYQLLKNQTEYQDLGADYFDRRDRERATRRLIQRLERMGYKVEVQAAA